MDLKALPFQELDQLPTLELAERMDTVLEARDREASGEHYDMLHGHWPRAAMFLATAAVAEMDEVAKRRSLYAAFEYLLQMQFVQIALGLHNRCFYDDPRHSDVQPVPPSLRIVDASIRQWIILSSRAAFERFADLLHIIERGERIQAPRSRLAKLRDLLFRPSSRFVYFAPVVRLVRRFDDAHRTAAAHGGSALPRHFLSLQEPEDGLMQRELDLTNLLLNLWRPLIDLLNGTRPNYVYGDMELRWLEAFLSGEESRIEAELTLLRTK